MVRDLHLHRKCVALRSKSKMKTIEDLYLNIFKHLMFWSVYIYVELYWSFAKDSANSFGNSDVSSFFPPICQAIGTSSPLCHRGIYDLHIIELKHVPFLETLPEGEMIELQVPWGDRDPSADWWLVGPSGRDMSAHMCLNICLNDLKWVTFGDIWRLRVRHLRNIDGNRWMFSKDHPWKTVDFG